jgi:hypothetical protein
MNTHGLARSLGTPIGLDAVILAVTNAGITAIRVVHSTSGVAATPTPQPLESIAPIAAP